MSSLHILQYNITHHCPLSHCLSPAPSSTISTSQSLLSSGTLSPQSPVTSVSPATATETGEFVIQLGKKEAEETFRGFMVLTQSPGE